jgi:hypothetical protein
MMNIIWKYLYDIDACSSEKRCMKTNRDIDKSAYQSGHKHKVSGNALVQMYVIHRLPINRQPAAVLKNTKTAKNDKILYGNIYMRKALALRTQNVIKHPKDV